MKYLLYRTTNMVNGKIYIGVHKTNDLDDGYMGSGKILKYAIEKYGIENFQKDIIYTFNSAAEMFDMESILVDEDFVKRTDTYNLKLGGHGGWDYLNSTKLNHTRNFSKEDGDKGRRIQQVKRKDPIYNKIYCEQRSKQMKDFYKNNPGTFTNRTHTEEAKKKIGSANSKHQIGKKNSQFGTMWITNEVINKKIKKDSPMPEGFRRGRITGCSRGGHEDSKPSGAVSITAQPAKI